MRCGGSLNIAHMPHLTEWRLLGLFRWGATLMFGPFALVLLEENYRNLFEEYHLNTRWRLGAKLLPDVTLLPEAGWLWLGTGLSGGLALALWVAKVFPASNNASPGLGSPQIAIPSAPVATHEESLNSEIAREFGPEDHFLALAGSLDQVAVIGFQATGANLSKRPIAEISGYAQSNMTNERFPMFMVVNRELTKPEDTYGIPPNTKSQISCPFTLGNPAVDRIPVERFLVDFTEIIFVFNYDGKTYQRRFIENEIEQQVMRSRRDIRLQRRRQGVRVKD
jgi:hypothetical protein